MQRSCSSSAIVPIKIVTNFCARNYDVFFRLWKVRWIPSVWVAAVRSGASCQTTWRVVGPRANVTGCFWCSDVTRKVKGKEIINLQLIIDSCTQKAKDRRWIITINEADDMQNVTFKSHSAEIFFTDRTKYPHWTWDLIINSRINISQVLTPTPPECYNAEAIPFTRCLHSEIHYIYILYFTTISDNLGKVEAYSGAVFVSRRVSSFMKASEEKDRNTFLVWRNITRKTDIRE